MLTVLRRWLNGEARASDERALDAAARKDPFVADAMEGYRAFADANHEARLNKLRARIQERSGQKRRGIVYLLPRAVAIAASVLLLAGMGWWLLREPAAESQQLSNNEIQPASEPGDTGTNQAIAQLEREAPVVNDAPGPAQPPASALYRYNRRSKELDVVPVEAEQLALNELDNFSTDDKIAAAEEAVAKPEAAQKAVASDASAGGVRAQTEDALSYQPATKSTAPAAPGNPARGEARKDVAADAAKTAKEKQNSLRNLYGRVTDPQGEPIIGANVLIEGTNRGVSTDFEGNFNLPLSGDEKQLVVQYTGYETLKTPIKAQGPMNVTLHENAVALDEVVVSSFSKKKSEAKTSRIVPTAAPVSGTEAYQEYLAQNLRYPAAARDKAIQGVVRLRFTVNKNGKLSNFKVVQSLGYGCDEEAIRLIKEGPAWKINGDARKVEVDWEIQF